MTKFDPYNFANFIPEIIFVYIFPNTKAYILQIYY